jgi:dephospho-CoA kinase
MIIGITGSIGSGKTTIAKIFSKYHYVRIDADEISHNLMKNNKKIYNKIIKQFGTSILKYKNNKKNIEIGRKKLGEIVFNENAKLRKLNSIMHPAIVIEIKNEIKKRKKKCGNHSKIIIDAPLLLETHAKKLVDKIIVVHTPPRKIISRNKKFSLKQLKKISKLQMPLNEKLKKADFLINNGGNLKNTEKQVIKIINSFKKEK